jgi:hypothetical protein
MHPVSTATAKAASGRGKVKNMAAIGFGGEVRSPKPRPWSMEVSRNLSRAPAASLRDQCRVVSAAR